MDGVVTMQAVPEIRIDGYEADLVPINWLGVAADGAIAVAQSQDRLIRFFDQAGTFQSSFGGEGAGPGEFQAVIRGGWKGDTLWVSDPFLRRITLISPERTFLRTTPPLSAARPMPADGDSLPDFPFVFPYALYAGDSMLVSAQGSAGDALSESLGHVLLRISVEGWIGHVLTQLPGQGGSLRIDLPGGGIAAVSAPFAPRLSWAVSPTGERIVVLTTNLSTDPPAFTVILMDARGDPLVEVAIPFQGESIPSQLVDSILAVRTREASNPAVRDAYLSGAVRDLVPPVYPPVEDVMISDAGRVWIGLRVIGGRRPWLNLDATGRPIATVLLPPTGFIKVADTNNLWTIESDELDVESVIRYRLTR